MNIIAHRGCWGKADERNTYRAILRALEYGYGIETDIRDYERKLVVSHNIADANCFQLEDVFAFYKNNGCNQALALNVKADGIQHLLKPLLKKYSICNYFLFDMSVPELIVNDREGLRYFTRHSDVETECVMYSGADGVWVDSFFDKKWITADVVRTHIADKKSVCIVSPELHGYEYKSMWRMLKKEKDINSSELVSLCTDMPQIAYEYFKGEKV